MQTGSLLAEVAVGRFVIIALVLPSCTHSCRGAVCTALLGNCYVYISLTLTVPFLLSHI